MDSLCRTQMEMILIRPMDSCRHILECFSVSERTNDCVRNVRNRNGAGKVMGALWKSFLSYADYRKIDFNRILKIVSLRDLENRILNTMKGSQIVSRVKVPRSAVSALARRSLMTLAPAAARQITMAACQKVFLLHYYFSSFGR